MHHTGAIICNNSLGIHRNKQVLYSKNINVGFTMLDTNQILLKVTWFSVLGSFEGISITGGAVNLRSRCIF